MPNTAIATPRVVFSPKSSLASSAGINNRVTQVSANPVRFVAFVNRMSGFPVQYTQYLENCVRRDLGFPLVPVSIELRQSKKTGRQQST